MVRDSFATLPARLNEKGVTDDLADIADIVELDTHNDTDDDPCEVELVADAAASNNASEILVQQPTADSPVLISSAQETAPTREAEGGKVAASASALDDFDRIVWDINEEHERALDNIVDSLTKDINANDFVASISPSMHVPAPDLADTDDDEAAPDPGDTDDEDDRDTRAATTSQEWLELEKHARNQVDTGRRLRSGTVHARSSHVYHPDNHALIKNIIRAAHPVENDVREQAHAARTFAYELTKSEQRYEHAFHASAPADPTTSALHAKQAISQIQDERKLRRRYVTDIQTGELLDVVTEGYYDLGLNDITPDGRIETASFIRLLKRALKSTIQAHPERKEALAPDLKLLTTPKSAKEALASPQWREWRAAIDKELASLIQKGVYEVRKIPHGVKAIPTKLVLRIKLKSDGTVEKYKVRCVALGFLQRAGLHYHPDECYSPMSDPSTTRTLVALSNALDLNIDHLDVAVAYLNGVLPTDQRFFCLPPPGFEETAGYGWYMLKGLYGTKQGGALWAKTFRDWMRREQPQFIEAGNERVCYVFREGYDGAPIDLDNLRGLTLEPNEKLIILCMNTDDMLIAYTDSARHLVDEFERSLNASYTSTPRTPLEYYLGMHVQRDREKRVLSIDVRRHIYDFIRSMGLDPFSSASVSTPLDPNVLFSKADCPPVIDAEIKERVLRAHGKLIHMAIWARPDLAHCVSVLGRYVHNPSQKHLDAYLRVARYLIKTKDLRIVYGTHDTHGLVLYGFSDSDWGADPDSYRSTGAYIFFLDGAACSWKVKLSSTALLSSQESEYVAGSEATKEALNLRMLLEHLGFGDPRPTDIYVDNKGAITMGLHPANKPATRHVNMRMHMLRQHVELGHVSTPFCPTFDMVADYMTKATPKPTHERHNARTMGSQSLAPPLTLIQHLID